MGDQLGDQAGEDGDGLVVIVERDGGRPVPSGLRPFRAGDPRAAAAGKRSAEARRARRAAEVGDPRALGELLRQVVETFGRDQLGPSSASVAGWLLGRLVAGDIPVRNGGEAAELLRVLVDVARLEAGEPTSASVVAHLGADAAARVVALREEARATLRSSPVQAAAALPGGALPPTATTAGDGDDGGVVPA